MAKFQKSDFVQNTDISGYPVPQPCTTAENDWEANPELWDLCAGISTKKFRTASDIILCETIKTGQLYADIFTGRIYNPTSGRFLKPNKKNDGYLYVNCLLDKTRSLDIPVHRFVYYAAHPETPLGMNFDVHHVDGNRENNRISNLEAVPRELHTRLGARKTVQEAETCYLLIVNAKKHGTRVSGEYVRALRICTKQLPPKSHHRTIIFDYFAEKMGISHEFCRKLNSRQRGHFIQPPTPEEEEAILKEYAWLIEDAKHDRRPAAARKAPEASA